jgi:hypothetical protein
MNNYRSIDKKTPEVVDNTTNDTYPKTLYIRNEVGGMVWQVYHVNNITEALNLVKNAVKNGFYGNHTLEDHTNETETWPDWRKTAHPDIFK